MTALETDPPVPRTLDVAMRPFFSETGRKLTNFQGTWALLFVLVVNDALIKTLLFPNGEETVRIM
jgi:hypothetical protein